MRKKLLYSIAMMIYLVLSCGHDMAGADTVYLKNGGKLEGIIEKEDREAVILEMGGGSARINKDEIRNIARSDADGRKAMKASFKQRKSELERKEKEFNVERDRRFEEYQRWQEEEEKKKADEGVESKEVQAIPGKTYEGERVSDSILVEAVIDDKVKVVLVVDTGATSIMLQRKIGERLGFDMSDTKKDIVEAELADGRRVKEKKVILKKVNVQGMEENDVPATIALDDIESTTLRDGLLGMSFLNRFNFKIDRRTMKITLERIGKK